VNASPTAALARTLGGRNAGGRGWRVARQIVENISGFFSVLAELSRGEMPPQANDVGNPDASDNGEARHEP
jgi:hypothetical protein